MPAQGMFNGGIIRLQKGGFLDREFTSSRPGPYNRSTVRESIEDALARGASMADLLAIFRNQPEAIDLVKQLVADRQRASVSQYNPPLEEVTVDAQRRQPDMGLMSLSSAMQERPEFAYPQLQEVSVDAQRIEPMVQPSASTFATMPKMSETIPPLSLRIADSLGFFDDMKEDARQRNAISNLPAEPMASAIANKLVDRYMVSEDDFATARQVAQLNPAGRYAEQLASMRLPEGAGSNIPEMFQSGRDANTQLASLPRLPEGAGSNFPEVFQSGRDVNTQLASLPSGSLPSGTNFLSSIAEGMRQTPFGKYSRAAEQGIMDVYEKDGLGAAFGETGRAGLGGLLSLGETVAEGYKPAAKALVGATDYLTSGPARALDQFLTGSTEDPLTLGDIAGYFSGGPQEGDLDQLQEVTVDAKAREYSPELKALLETAQAGTQDESKKESGQAGTGSKEVQGTSGAQRQATPKGEPSLYFADLLADMKKQTMAQSLVQLGAGIAGGDLSKGISAAGMAAMKGDQAAKALAMRGRLAEYEAGREDLAREERGRQFDEQMDLLESKVEATLTASSATSQRENLRALAGEVASLRENFAIMSDAEKARFKVLEQQLYSMLGISMPQGDVVAGIPTGESEWGIAGR